MLYGQLDPPPYCPLLILAQSNFLPLLLRVLMFVSPSSCDLDLVADQWYFLKRVDMFGTLVTCDWFVLCGSCCYPQL